MTTGEHTRGARFVRSGISHVEGSRASVVQVDASGSGGLVDPGVACWVGISGELGAREESGMSAWQFAVMKLARALLRLAFDRSFQCPVHSGRKWYTLHFWQMVLGLMCLLINSLTSGKYFITDDNLSSNWARARRPGARRAPRGHWGKGGPPGGRAYMSHKSFNVAVCTRTTVTCKG